MLLHLFHHFSNLRHIYFQFQKNIFLSLLDHKDDYFFGSDSSSLHQSFSLRFIEGIGATCANRPMRDPYLSLLLCVYKDDSLVYLADESLGCDQTCVGLQEYQRTSMNLYPNPASSYIVMDMGTGEELEGNVLITDVMGRVCLQQPVSGSSIRLPVADLPKGMYFLTYTGHGKNLTRKFVKE